LSSFDPSEILMGASFLGGKVNLCASYKLECFDVPLKMPMGITSTTKMVLGT
jgi:hypothetical protein